MSKRALIYWVTLVAVLSFARSSRAAPTAHILRIDPRAGMADGQPVLTTVIEIVQFTPMSEVVTNAGCGAQKGDPLLDCTSTAVEKKNALWQAFPWQPSARLMVRVDGGDVPAKFVSNTSWGSSTKDPLVGTAWLIALDASSEMGPRYADAREVAHQFLATMDKNDIAKLIIFDDRLNTYTATTPWTPAAQSANLIKVLTSIPSAVPSHNKERPFFNEIKSITSAFADIGNANGIQQVPMHQAMVVLSNGAGRSDPNSPAASADILKQFFDKGRFPEDNPLSPKTPLPVISIYFPNAHGTANDLYATNDMQFMEDLSNPEIGGFFDIVRTGQGLEKSKVILSNVKNRFNQMWVVKWRLSCLASTPEQTFNLIFGVTTPTIIPDGSFQAVPIGVDPTTWPLDINVAQTQAEANANPVHPGGSMRIYGDFCWAGEKTRAEAYFVPAGTKPDPNVNRSDPDVAKRAMQSLIAQNMHGTASDATDTTVTINVPDEERILDGTGDNQVVHVVIYDNKAHRASGLDEKTVLTLKATKKPLNLPIILGAAGLVVVILLLVIVLLRGGGGGGGKQRRGNAPPAPVVAGGGGYGGGYGGGPPGGGYGGGGGYQQQGMSGAQMQGAGFTAGPPRNDPPAPAPQAPVAFHRSTEAAPQLLAQPYQPPPPPPAPAPPRQEAPQAQPPNPGGGYPLAGAGGAPLEVRCPACNMLTMASPGGGGVCFSCGQPLPKGLGAAPPPPEAPSFPLTGALPSNLTPPPNPYVSAAASATIIGAAGQFAIRGGVEVRVGRDPAQCPILLSEPRVSGVHATLKFENGSLMVRDEASNNGTFVSGARIAAHAWTPVPPGGSLKFGPIEFTARVE